MKTNGARFLESLGIKFELREYDVDPEDLSAISVAKKVGMPPEQVFKTLLTTGVPSDRSSSQGWSTGGTGTYVFAVIPGDAELDFKKLARAAGTFGDAAAGTGGRKTPGRMNRKLRRCDQEANI